MSLPGLLLGLINIAIVVAVLLLIGAIAVWLLAWLGFAIPAQVQKLYMVIVALVALYMLAAMLLGIPSWRVIGSSSQVPPVKGTIAAPPSIVKYRS